MKHFAAIFGFMAVSACMGAQQPHASSESAAPHRGVREMTDASTGTRWMLVRDRAHPGGPGRMVVLDGSSAAPAAPVMRAGDEVRVEEHSERVDLQLMAVALGPAAVGDWVTLKLRIGGSTVHARVVGRGRAVLAEPGAVGVQP